MPGQVPPADFVGAVRDATTITGPLLEDVAHELWNIAVLPRMLAPDALLSTSEQALIAKLGECAGLFARIYEEDTAQGKVKATTHSNDLGEVVTFIHALQARVLSRAAARAYPGVYRLL